MTARSFLLLPSVALSSIHLVQPFPVLSRPPLQVVSYYVFLDVNRTDKAHFSAFCLMFDFHLLSVPRPGQKPIADPDLASAHHPFLSSLASVVGPWHFCNDSVKGAPIQLFVLRNAYSFAQQKVRQCPRFWLQLPLFVNSGHGLWPDCTCMCALRGRHDRPPFLNCVPASLLSRNSLFPFKEVAMDGQTSR